MTTPFYADDLVTVHHGDCLDVMRTLSDASVDAVVTDPPYGLGFMGKEWDSTFVAADMPMRRSGAQDAVNAGAARQGGRQRAGVDYQRRMARDSHDFGAWCEEWARECLRVLKPGGHLLTFGGTRTWHRLACGVEDAGFELRDSIAWLYGSGFPKSLDVSKALDKAAGAEREVIGKRTDGRYGSGFSEAAKKAMGSAVAAESTTGFSGDIGIITAPATEAAEQWQGWGTALKPAFEPIIVARKPLIGTVVANILEHGTGALNIDACRTATTDTLSGSGTPPLQFGGMNHRPFHDQHREGEASAERRYTDAGATNFAATPGPRGGDDRGRWPTNVVLDDTQTAELDAQTGVLTSGANPTRRGSDKFRDAYGDFAGQEECTPARGADSGGASRFFPTFRYEAKAPTVERPRDGDIAHPTVKPLDLMRWLVRLVTPPGGTVLEPFAGSGTTAEACVIEGFQCIAVEREEAYLPLIVARLSKPIQPDLFGAAS